MSLVKNRVDCVPTVPTLVVSTDGLMPPEVETGPGSAHASSHPSSAVSSVVINAFQEVQRQTPQHSPATPIGHAAPIEGPHTSGLAPRPQSPPPYVPTNAFSHIMQKVFQIPATKWAKRILKKKAKQPPKDVSNTNYLERIQGLK